MPDIMILLSLATYFVIINDQFMSLQRNKFIDRFKTQIIKPSTHPSGEKTDRQMQPNSSTHLRSINTKHSHSKSLDIHEVIVRNLEKHITYLEKKLKDEEQQTERTRNLLDAAQRKIVDLDTKHHELVEQMEELHECLKKTERNYDMVRSDYQNLVLKQKMEKLSGQVNQKKQAYARLQLRHNFKKGRFSSAFLPTSFGSPGKYKERNEKQYKPIIKEYEVKNMEQQSVIAKQAYENCISNEYRLIKEENDELVKKVQELSQKNAKLIQQLNKKDQSHEKQDALQAEIERLFKENQELKLKIEEILSQNKRFLSKIAQNEQKMIEISMVLNQRSSSVSSLQHNSIKIEKQIQTERLYNPEAKSQTDTKQLEERIQILPKKMQEKDEEVRRQKIEDNSQVKDLFNLMKKCNEQISEIEDIQQETRPPQNGQILEEAEPQKCKQEEQATQNNNKAASQSEQKQKITCESVHQ